jgi:AcrR family transcriptional regulator
MGERKTDRRVIRTRKLLSEALFALILEKGYDSVTIQDITDRANLGRATFYLHYRDKEELLMTMLEGVFEDLLDHASHVVKSEMSMTRSFPMLYIFHHAAEHSDLYRALFQAQVGQGIAWKMQDFLALRAQELTGIWEQEAPSSVPVEMWTNWLAGSFLALVRWWLENNMPYSPEYMEHIFWQLSLPGVFRMIGMEMDQMEARVGSIIPENRLRKWNG